MIGTRPQWLHPMLWALIEHLPDLHEDGVMENVYGLQAFFPWADAGFPVLADRPATSKALTIPAGHFPTVQVALDQLRDLGHDALADHAQAELVQRVARDTAVPWALLEQWLTGWQHPLESPHAGVVRETKAALASHLDGCPARLATAILEGWATLRVSGSGVFLEVELFPAMDVGHYAKWKAGGWGDGDAWWVGPAQLSARRAAWGDLDGDQRRVLLVAWEHVRAWRAGGAAPWAAN